MQRRRRKYPRFVDLSRRRQRDAYIRLRWRILQQVPENGGMFSCPLPLGVPNGPDAPGQWFDFQFLGLDGRTIWDATILTAQQATRDQVSDLVWRRARDMLTEAEQEYEFHLRREVHHDADGRKYYESIRSKPHGHDAFGGLTFNEYRRKAEADMLRNDPPVIRESYHLDPSYRYGIGLDMVVNAPEITREVIEDAIRHFREIGERDWESPSLVPREHMDLSPEGGPTAISKIPGS